MTKPPLMIFVLTAFAAAVSAQHFPPELTFPRTAQEDEAGDSEPDSGGVPPTLIFSVDQTLFDRSYTTVNSVLYAQNFDSAAVEQSLSYELRRDRFKNTRHYLSTPGALTYSLKSYGWITPGLDWAPVAQYSSDRAGRNALATIDIGPTAGFNVAGVPVMLRTGISGRRLDSLAGRFTPGDYRSSVGAYGAFRVGSLDERLSFAPVYFHADGTGRRIESSGMASLTSSALGALRIGEKDSLFVYGSISFFNGREGYLEGSADSRAALLNETPWRVERNVAAIAGYKAAKRLIFFPSLYYSVRENRLEFLNDTRLRDEKILRQTLSGAVSTDSAAGLYYSGVMTFEWRGHDKLFGRNIPIILTSESIDSSEVRVNLWDYTSFDPRTTHRLILKLPLSFRLKYDFSLARFLTEHPNYYIRGNNTVTNSDDNDRRTRAQRLALEYRNDSTLRAELFGELIDYDLVFLRQAKSSSNRTDNTQRAGLLLEWAPMNELLITEAIYAEAKKGAFHFPAFHQNALQRPSYSRAVNSSLTAAWQPTRLVGFKGLWNIKLSDFGFWYGREYMQEELAADSGARTDYYAIAAKSVFYTVDAAVRLMPGDALIEAGAAITAARDLGYSGGTYIITNENGLSVKPYAGATVKLRERVELSAYLSRTLVPGDDALGYWDFRLQAEGWF